MIKSAVAHLMEAAAFLYSILNNDKKGCDFKRNDFFIEGAMLYFVGV